MHMPIALRATQSRRVSAQLSLALASALLVPAVGLAVAGVQAHDTSTAIPTVHVDTIHGTERVPGLLTAGLVRFQLKDGAQPGSVLLARLHKGVTQATFEAALQKNQNAAFGLITMVGGAESNAQASAAVTANLSAGTYVSVIQTSSPQPSLSFFTVRPGKGATVAPKATATIRELEHGQHMGFDIPSVIPAGRDILQVVNTGDSTHEFQLMRLHRGKTKADLVTFLAAGMKGPAPADQAGGLPPQTGDGINWLETTLTPGSYVAVCGMQDTPTSKPHFMLGMIATFTVR